MTEPKPGTKTLVIRLPEDLHAQVALVAQLDNTSLVDIVRRAIDAYVSTRREGGQLAAQAEAALAALDEETASRREALTALLGSAGAKPSAPRRRPGKENGD